MRAEYMARITLFTMALFLTILDETAKTKLIRRICKCLENVVDNERNS